MSLLRYAKLKSAAIVICRLLAAMAQTASHVSGRCTASARLQRLTCPPVKYGRNIGRQGARSMKTSNSSMMRNGEDATPPTASVNATLMYDRSPPVYTIRLSTYSPRNLGGHVRI